MEHLTKKELKASIKNKLANVLGVDTETASDALYYKALSMVVVDILQEKRRRFSVDTNSNGKKQVYYLCMEFLMGRSLKNSLYNLEIVDTVRDALDDYGVKLEKLYDYEPDAGLGNGGLGRLAACFLDALATQDYPATGYSICYEYGIFKQKIVDGWQTELPDYWLPGGEVWLSAKPEKSVDVHFGGEVEEFWDNNYHHINYKNYTTVKAVPYDMYVTGYNSKGVSRLRLWKATASGLDMERFNRGDYIGALGANSMAEVISKVLYPNDNHNEGKSLRLRQQYFMVAASVGDIINRHMATYGTLDNLAEKVAIHINDTHPTLAIPELMRILLDDCGYSWDVAWNTVTQVFAYTNHTVMSEALEKWNEDLFASLLPRIYQIIKEMNNRFTYDLYNTYHLDYPTVEQMAIISNRTIHMANLCVMACHSVNGVSALHSEIIKKDVFQQFYRIMPHKFTNVTNGIASRRWLYQSNEGLTRLLKETIGDGFLRDMGQLEKFNPFVDDKNVLDTLATVKLENKQSFCAYIERTTGVVLDPNSIFDAQVKRLHEYKRQHLNALHILTTYQWLKQNPNAEFTPHTYIFGAKAAPGYFLAKQIIKLICTLRDEIEKDPVIREKLRIVYLEDYRVTLSELLMPAAEVSQQISLAGTEASGTGNMKLMLNGALTLGTYDGANVEIAQHVGEENMFIFGMRTEDVAREKASYDPRSIYRDNPVLKDALDQLSKGIGGSTFPDIFHSLVDRDPYMVLKDYDSYAAAHRLVMSTYADQYKWQAMSLRNIAQSGFFCADRATCEYAQNIWELR
ncbi:glycogen/starch/alpha-glucan phosphorylase [Hydrogenoanaerobacterium sp.]|uniref:glycogen/starch/alpha-glucan phosphorylase n=1 Tax=Hydrogenoanaerobacterium sp. TaxID=2953763 RepID=UPI00289F0863|nr:glycogen/starch/alpha-glucan phosphorylase [Hydrogenoanaerobacterium sp.]